MRSRILSAMWQASVVVTFVACLVQLAVASDPPGCTSPGHGAACTTPPGCTITQSLEDTPGSCCYKTGSTCCKYIRWKYVYNTGCSTHNCSDCEGPPESDPGFTCNLTNGFCES